MNRVLKLSEIAKIRIYDEPILMGRDEVLVKVLQCGICGSDLHYFRYGGLGSYRNKLPMNLGHECIGIVKDSNKTKFKIGDFVAIEPSKPCWNCEYCLTGHHNLCKKQLFLGTENYIGGMRDYIAVNETQLFRMPKDTNPDFAVMLEPLSVAIHAIDLLKSSLINKKICILGAGPIGLLCAYLLKQHKQNICISDINSDRLDFAEKMLPDITVKHFYNLISDSDFVIDCAGTQESFDKALKMLKPGGKLVLVGIPENDYLMLNPHIARTKELTIVNCRRSTKSLEFTYKTALDNNIPLEKMVTHHWIPEQANAAFWTLSRYKDKCIKGVIKFGDIKDICNKRK